MLSLRYPFQGTAQAFGTYFLMSKKSNLIFLLGLVLLFATQVIIAMQGFDVCDEGSKLTFFQQFFNDIGSVRYNFVHYISGILGGVWYKLYPSGGILWFRLLTIIVQLSTLLVCYHFLKKFFDRKFIFFGLCIAFFLNDFGFLAFYHNHLTAFINALVVVVLFNALKKESKKHFLAAGILVGINVFVRIPNLLLISFGLVLFFNKLFVRNHLSWSTTFRFLSFYGLGVLIGFFVVFILQLALGHLSLMKEAIATLFQFSQASDSDHNLLRMIKIELFNYYTITKFMAVLLFLAVVFSFCFKKICNYKPLVVVLYVVLFFVFSFLIFNGGIRFVYAFCTLILTYVLLSKKENDAFRLLAFLSLLMMYVTPLGSSEGIYNTGYICLWIALPFSIVFLATKLSFNSPFISISINQKPFRLFVLVFVGAALMTKAYLIVYNAYFDYGPRWHKTHAINSDFAKGIYTTKEKADIINDLLVVLPNFVKPGDLLLTYDSIPMIHFFTQTRPFMYNPWVWIYDGYSFSKQLNKAVKERPYLPVVIQQKFETIGGFGEPNPNYLREDKTRDVYSYNVERVKAFNQFISDHQYSISWSNAHFNIYEVHPEN